MAEQETKKAEGAEETEKTAEAREEPGGEAAGQPSGKAEGQSDGRSDGQEETVPETDNGREEAAEEADSAEEESGDAPEGEDPKTWAEKRAAKKQAKLDKKAQGYKEQIEQLEDKVKRQLAEFENFRNRTEKEKHAMFETGAKSVVEKILPIVDNFERGLATVPEDRKEDPFVDGMARIYKQLLTELENIGVKPIEAVGQEFDPALHNAVMQVESEEYDAGIVAQELQKGYTYHDSVVRHSMVAVVKE